MVPWERAGAPRHAGAVRLAGGHTPAGGPRGSRLPAPSPTPAASGPHRLAGVKWGLAWLWSALPGGRVVSSVFSRLVGHSWVFLGELQNGRPFSHLDVLLLRHY